MRNYLCANYNDIREAISRKFRHYVAHCIVKLLSGNGEFSFYLLLARSLVGCICVSLGSSRGSVSLRLKITRCCPWNTRVSWNSTIFDSSTHLASIKPISEDRKKKWYAGNRNRLKLKSMNETRTSILLANSLTNNYTRARHTMKFSRFTAQQLLEWHFGISNVARCVQIVHAWQLYIAASIMTSIGVEDI